MRKDLRLMRLLGVVAVLATGCLSSPSRGNDAGPGDGDASGECPAVEPADFTPAPPNWVGNVLDLEFDDLSDHVFHDRSGARRDVAQLAAPRGDGPDGPDGAHGRAPVLGASTYLAIPDDAAFDLQVFTIEMWVMRGVSVSATTLLSDYDTDLGTMELSLSSDGVVTFGVNGLAPVSGDSFPDGVWVHIAVTRDESGEVCFFLNGNKNQCHVDQPDPIPTDEPRNWSIGRRSDGMFPFPGPIDALRISDRVRTASELQMSMLQGGAESLCGDLVVSEEEGCEPNAHCCSATCDVVEDGCGEAGCSEGVCDLSSCATPPKFGLLALYELDEGDGMVASDSAQTSEPLDLMLSGAADFTEQGLKLAGGRALPIGDPSRLIEAIEDSGELTIDVWLTTSSTDAATPYVPIVALSSDEGGINAALGINTNSSATYSARIASGLAADGQPNVEGPVGDAPTDVPTHVVVTRTAEGVRSLYVNGRLRSASHVGGDLSWTGGTVELGARAIDGETWSGVLHRVAIYSVALDAGEVAASFWATRE